MFSSTYSFESTTVHLFALIYHVSTEANVCCCLSCFIFKQDYILDKIAPIKFVVTFEEDGDLHSPIHQRQSRFLIFPEP